MDKKIDKLKKKPELVELGRRLQELRENKGKSQKEAAGDLGIKASTLSSYEVGDKEPPITKLNGIAQHYNVTVDYLTGNSAFKTPQAENINNILSDILNNTDNDEVKTIIEKVAEQVAGIQNLFINSVRLNPYNVAFFKNFSNIVEQIFLMNLASKSKESFQNIYAELAEYKQKANESLEKIIGDYVINQAIIAKVQSGKEV